MKKIKILVSVIILVCMSLLPAQTAREIMELSRQRTTLPGLEAITTLQISDSRGNVRNRKIAMASKSYPDGIEKRIIRFLEPADVSGMGMLVIDYPAQDDAMWIYLPFKQAARRMVSSEKSRSFMGSEFSNADMSAPNLDDFTFVLMENDTILNQPCYKISSTPKTKELKENYGLSKTITWVNKNTALPLQRQIYDLKNNHQKTMSILETRLLDNTSLLYSITKMKIVNHLTQRSSLMEMQQIQMNPSIPDRYFTISYLENN